MSERAGQGNVRFPKRIFYLSIGLVCIGLAISATYSYIALIQLQVRYLESIGNEVAGEIHRETRGRGRRSDVSQWQTALNGILDRYGERVAFVVLVDNAGKVLAAAGSNQLELAALEEGAKKEGLYMFSSEVLSPMGPRWDESRGQPNGWTLKVGVYSDRAGYLMKQAYLQVIMAGLAISVLVAVSFVLIRTLDKFVALRVREEADRHLATLGRMSAALAHEIRNPLGAMKGLTQVVQEDLPRDHAAQGLMQTVVSEAERLESLVSDLLDFARPRQLIPDNVDLEVLFGDVCGLFESRAEAEGIHVESSVDREASHLVTDRDALHQVLLNVLINALDAAGEGGHVRLESALDSSSGKVLISVRDEGKGLEGKDPESLFEPFKTTKTSGTGLGLAVSRRLVETLGGEMHLYENSNGKGVTCRITLPFLIGVPSASSERDSD